MNGTLEMFELLMFSPFLTVVCAACDVLASYVRGRSGVIGSAWLVCKELHVPSWTSRLQHTSLVNENCVCKGLCGPMLPCTLFIH